MRIGELDQRIGLYSVAVTDNFGETVETYALEDTVWGMVTGARGQEAINAARNNARETIRVKIRYRTDLDVTWRITWESQTYNIIHVDRTARRDGALWLTCENVEAV